MNSRIEKVRSLLKIEPMTSGAIARHLKLSASKTFDVIAELSNEIVCIEGLWHLK
jgi:DNA-binding transcriptional regulator LsrR (DeoR family)